MFGGDRPTISHSIAPIDCIGVDKSSKLLTRLRATKSGWRPSTSKMYCHRSVRLHPGSIISRPMEVGASSGLSNSCPPVGMTARAPSLAFQLMNAVVLLTTAVDETRYLPCLQCLRLSGPTRLIYLLQPRLATPLSGPSRNCLRSLLSYLRWSDTSIPQSLN